MCAPPVSTGSTDDWHNYGGAMAGGVPNNFGLGRVGVWTFALDLQPMRKSQEAAQELEELGYGCIWVPEAVGREPFASCALLLSGTKRIGEIGRAHV